MKGGVRKFGRAERGLLPEGRLSGPMPWVIAIMMFLTVLAAAAGMGLASAAARLDDQIGGRVTNQIVEANPARKAAQAAAAAASTVRNIMIAITQGIGPAIRPSGSRPRSAAPNLRTPPFMCRPAWADGAAHR
jgi:cell division transport system permease protein